MKEFEKGTRGRPEKAKSKQSRKKRRQAEAELEEEQRLTTLLFGGGGAADNKNEREGGNEKVPPEDSLFEIDRVGEESVDNAIPKVCDADESNEKEAAWQDEDDMKIDLVGTSRLSKLRQSRTENSVLTQQSDLEQRLRKRYESTAQMSARTDWADMKTGDESSDEDDQEDSAEPLLLVNASRLPANVLNTMRCPDANQSDPNQATVQAVHFHPGSDPDRPLLLTAGFDKTLRFFQVGADKSEKVHGIHFPKLPIYSASFLGSSGNVVVTGRRPFFYLYDAVAGKLDHVPRILGREEKSLERCTASPDGRTLAFCGNDGYIILYSAAHKHWIADLKMNGSVRAITFTPDGEQIIASGSDGDVYRWDLKSRQCIERFSNEDGTITSALAATSRHLAVGAESGVVNLYSERSSGTSTASKLFAGSTRKDPLKSIMNLHTSADMVRFNHDGQILAMSSRREKMGMKLLHVPTATVFSNWPTSKTPLNYVWTMDFSPKSRYMAVGNDKGKCLLYRMMHYQD